MPLIPLETRINAQLQKEGLTESVDVQTLRSDTHDSIEEMIEVEEAVRALTSKEGVSLQNDRAGGAYQSHDVRDHADFARHFLTLQKHWADPHHPSHKTLKVLQTLADHRTQMSGKNQEMKNAEQAIGPEDCAHECMWRRMNGVDVFTMGFSHTQAYFQRHKDFYQTLAANAGGIVIEGYQTQKVGDSLWVAWAMKEGDSYGQLMETAAAANPNMLFFEADPRDDSFARYDELDPAAPTLPRQFLEQFYAHLIATDPQLVNKIGSVEELHQILRFLSHGNLEQACNQKMFEKDGVAYCPFPYINHQDGQWSLPDTPTGLEFGSLVFGDAVGSWNLRKITAHLQRGSFGSNKGPILDIQGANHIHNRKRFIDDPREAYRVIALHPHLAYLPVSEPAEYMNPPTVNTRNIREHLKHNPFALDPFNKDEHVPPELYSTMGFAVARIVNGEVEYTGPVAQTK